MHPLIGAEMSKARERELLERARHERYVRRVRRSSTRRPAEGFGGI